LLPTTPVTTTTTESHPLEADEPAVVRTAQAPDAQPGLGDGIELLHAGLVPDEVVPNTCYD
jgi:hypothetical protein